MMIFKLTILVFLFLIGNSIVGMFLWALWKGVVTKKVAENHAAENDGYARHFLVGTGFLFVLFAALTFLVIYREGGFHTLNKVFLLCYLVVLICSSAILFMVKSFRVYILQCMSQLKSKMYWKGQSLWLVLFFVIAITFFFHKPYLESRFDLPERMNTLEVVDTFGGINPLTGENGQAQSALEQWKKGVMPAWYLFFANMLDVPTYRMLFQVVPLWTLSLCMSAYYIIAQILFGENRKRIGYFMVFFTMFILGGNGAYMNPSYGLLHYGYEESTLLSNVVLPCVFALVLWMIKTVMSKRTGVKTWQNF